jgi:hypothetical protein
VPAVSVRASACRPVRPPGTNAASGGSSHTRCASSALAKVKSNNGTVSGDSGLKTAIRDLRKPDAADEDDE